MKKVLNISLGSRSFILEEDAYTRLNDYLNNFRSRLATTPENPFSQQAEVMEDLENRIAELFAQEVGTDGRVVKLDLVERVTRQLGMPDGTPESKTGDKNPGSCSYAPINKRIFRDIDNQRLAGVCAGIAAYLDTDVVVIRILMLVAAFLGTAGFWIYVICWIAIPAALTPSQKCEMHGLPITAENLARFAKSQK